MGQMSCWAFVPDAPTMLIIIMHATQSQQARNGHASVPMLPACMRACAPHRCCAPPSCGATLRALQRPRSSLRRSQPPGWCHPSPSQSCCGSRQVQVQASSASMGQRGIDRGHPSLGWGARTVHVGAGLTVCRQRLRLWGWGCVRTCRGGAVAVMPQMACIVGRDHVRHRIKNIKDLAKNRNIALRMHFVDAHAAQRAGHMVQGGACPAAPRLHQLLAHRPHGGRGEGRPPCVRTLTCKPCRLPSPSRAHSVLAPPV